MFGFLKKDKVTETPAVVPAHIGVIMDGNGRWAKKRMQPRVFGHKAGMDALRTVAIAASDVPELHQKNMKIQMIGETDRLPKQTFEALKKAEELTKLNTGLILNFALNYGGRAEITQAVKLIAQDVLDAKVNPGDITEELIGEYLFTGHLPKTLRDPDLIIRTSGELRLSNFLPWQAAYSELYFTDVLWPDFDEEALKEAIAEFNRRNRRFGGV